jgi:hypothetical protein
LANTATTPTGARETPQFDRDLFWSDEVSAHHSLDNEIPEDTDQIRFSRIRAVDYRAEFGDSVERRPNMEIRQHGDPQGLVRHPRQEYSLL